MKLLTITLRLEELEQRCGLPARTATTSPAFDACLGLTVRIPTCAKTYRVVSISYHSPLVTATLRAQPGIDIPR